MGHGMGRGVGRLTWRHRGKAEDSEGGERLEEPQRTVPAWGQRADLTWGAGLTGAEAQTARGWRWEQGWDGEGEGDRHGAREELATWDWGALPLTVSLEDLRLLKLDARVEVIALNVAFFLGSGSALPLFLS